ncbi:MAG: hypothetical protein HQM16_17445 [Deltaproteobacteria bacterium]|nr:hypothetical protein [Deltaproteobacteria bacterium]
MKEKTIVKKTRNRGLGLASETQPVKTSAAPAEQRPTKKLDGTKDNPDQQKADSPKNEWPRLLGLALSKLEELAVKTIFKTEEKTDVEALEDELTEDLKAKYIALGIHALPFIKENNSFGDQKISGIVTAIEGLMAEIKKLEAMKKGV